MTSTRTCPECGSTLAADVPSGLCPRCLVGQGLALLHLHPGQQAAPDKTEVIPPTPGPVAQPSAGLPSLGVHALACRSFADYELLEKIAQGGMGVVYRARQCSLNRMVALKMILSGQLATPAEVQRFKTEAEAAAKLDHPNIVPIYEIGEHEGQHYFSMKLVEGRRLSEEIGGKALPLRRAAQWLAKIARAVHFAHQRGVLHRDLKPANVLVEQNGEPQLTDFGLAKILERDSSLTGSVTVMGTASYMAPEQASGETRQITTATDIYGLGAIFYEMLTGRPPFQGKTAVETLRAVVEQDPVRPSLLNSELERDLETICLKCLEKSPGHRYASAGDLALDLERWLAGETISARPSTTWERTVKWARRKPAIASLAAALLLVGLAGFAGILWQWGQAREAWWFAEGKARDEAKQRKLLQVAARDLRRNLYVADINLAQKALAENNLGRAAELIRKYIPTPSEEDLRGFEWRYLWNELRGDELFTFAHENFVETAAFSADGKWLATLGRERIVKIWDVAGRRLLARLTNMDETIDRGAFLLFSPEGRFLVAASGTRDRLWVWETSAWKFLTILWDAKPPAFFLPGGDTLVTRAPNGMVFWTCNTWQPLARTWQPLASTSNDFSGMTRSWASSWDNKVIACVAQDEVHLWDIATRKKLNQFSCRLETINDISTAMAVSAQAGAFVIADWKGRVKIWDLQTGRELTNWLAHPSPVFGLSFSPDGTTLATSGLDQAIHLWQTRTWTKRGALRGHSNEVWTVNFSPDGQLLASTSKDGTAKLWSAQIQPEDNALANTIAPLAFVENGSKLLAVKTDRTVSLWDAAKRQELEPVPILDRSLSQFSTQPSALPALPGGSEYTGMILDPHLGTIEIWAKRDPHKTKMIVAQDGSPPYATLSPDKKLMAAAGEGCVKLINLADGAELARFPKASGPLAFSPDGRRLAGSGPNWSVMLWDVLAGKELATLQGHKWAIWACAFGPDGKLLATSCIDATVRLWDPQTGQALAVLSGHKEGVRCLAFSPDGKTLATGSTDDTVKLWSMATFQELLTLSSFGEDIGALIFSPDGQMLAVGCYPNRGGRKPVQLWRAPALAEIDAREKIASAAQ